MTVPVLRMLVKQHPQLKLTVVSRPFYQPFFADIPNVDFFAFQAKGRHKGFFGLWRLYRDLNPLKIDAFADLHDVLRSKVVRTFFALGGNKVAHTDKGREEKKALTRAENKIFQPLKTMFERHADTFEKLGFRIDLSRPEFPVKPKLDRAVIEFTGEKTKPWIGIAPFAQYDSKVYPQDLMHEIIQVLALKNQYEIFLFGAGSEKEKLAELAQGAAVKIVTGKLSFTQELQLISHLDMMLSMDSGNGHIAAMYGVKVITLFGATHPYAGFQPFDQPLENALIPDLEQFPKLPTSVYGNKKVAGYENAMRTIAPAEVVKLIESRITNH